MHCALTRAGIRLLVGLLAAAACAPEGWAELISPPAIQWQRSDGGTRAEEFGVVRQLADGGYILAGQSDSPASGNKTNSSFGWQDIWLIRLDGNGNKLWERTYGGTNNDYAYALVPTADGGFLVGGNSASGTNGNKTSPNFGALDFWAIRLDALGNKIWEKTFGGTNDDILHAAKQTDDDGFILGGSSNSGISGNKTSPWYGAEDMWLIRLDAQGNLLWQKTYGGANGDIMLGLEATAGGVYILAGYSDSPPSGNKTSARIAGDDYWAVRVNANGDKLWDRSYGGPDHDLGSSIVQTSDGGFMFAGNTISGQGGNKTQPSFGSMDVWLIRLDASGNQLADWTFGGTDYDVVYDMQPTADGGFVLCCSSVSAISGNKTTPTFGSTDYWIIRLDALGSKLWEDHYGGSDGDGAVSIQQTRDGGFIIGGNSWSLPGGDKTSPRWDIGINDYWTVKLGPDALSARPRLRAQSQTSAQVRSNGFRFFLSGPTGLLYAIEFTANLTTWSSFQTNQSTGSELQITDSRATNAPRGFYRARWLP